MSKCGCGKDGCPVERLKRRAPKPEKFRCRRCNLTDKREAFDNFTLLMGNPLCCVCSEALDKEAMERLDSPEFAKRCEEKRAEEQKDLEENYYLYEGECCDCFKPVHRHVKKDVIISGDGFRCGCVDRGMAEDMRRSN